MFEKLSTKLSGWKTFLLNWFSIILATIIWLGPDVLDYLTASDFAPLIPASWAPMATFFLGLANILVRRYTDGPPAVWAPPKSDEIV